MRNLQSIKKENTHVDPVFSAEAATLLQAVFKQTPTLDTQNMSNKPPTQQFCILVFKAVISITK